MLFGISRQDKVNYEVRRIWNEVTMAYFKALSSKLSGAAEENCVILFSARDSKTKPKVLSIISGNHFIATFQRERELYTPTFQHIEILITDRLLQDKTTDDYQVVNLFYLDE
jgi:hypothetical protein